MRYYPNYLLCTVSQSFIKDKFLFNWPIKLYYNLAGKAGSPGPVGQARVEGGGEDQHQDAELRRPHCTHTTNVVFKKSFDRKIY